MKLDYRISISFKLVLVVTAIIAATAFVLIHFSTELYQEESVTRVQEINKDTAGNISGNVFIAYQEAIKRMTLMAQFATKSLDDTEAKRAIKNALAGADDLISFIAYQIDDNGKPKPVYRVINDIALGEFGVTEDQVQFLPEKSLFEKQFQHPEEITFVNSSKFLNRPVYSLSFLSKKIVDSKSDDSKSKESEKKINAESTVQVKKHPLAGRWLFRSEMRQSALLKHLPKKKFLTTYVVDKDGYLIGHSDVYYAKQIFRNLSFSNYPIVNKLLQSRLSNHQMTYEIDNEPYLGAFKKVGVAGISVVAEVKRSHALATIERVKRISLWITSITICFAFFVNYIFSNTITNPLVRLYTATLEIMKGNFELKLKRRSSDEIGALTLAFNKMVEGLRERDKIKSAFSKFHSKEVAEKILSGELTLAGERKTATVFFSDIRSFTSISEKMSPDQVVNMLNSYMTEMVRIIFKWNGVVDKYVGDAIMAVWGVPESDADHAYNAIRASLEMRDFLVDYNKEQKAKSKVEINIGIGLHTGEVLAGNIGSEERLEYTVIGDTVNQAARIEAANKPLSADILISDYTYQLVKDRGIVVGPDLPIYAKGKTEALVLHQVIGYEENAKLVTSLSPEKLAFIKNQDVSNVDTDENKIKVGGGKSTSDSSAYNATPVSSPLNSGLQGPPSPFGSVAGGQPPTQFTPSANPPVNPEVTQFLDLPDAANAPEWYLCDDLNGSGTSGPYSIAQIKEFVNNQSVDPRVKYAFIPGKSPVQLVVQYPQFDVRQAVPNNFGAPGAHIVNNAVSKEYFIDAGGGQSQGPFSLQQLQQMFSSQQIHLQTLVWEKSFPQWTPLSHLPEFNRRSA